MNAGLLLIPLLFIRFILLGLLNKDALKRAAFFPPMKGLEEIFYLLYQLATLFIFIYLFFLTIHLDDWVSFVGLSTYVLGCLLLLMATITFAEKKQLITTGLFRLSRNPMYLGYFIYFLGCVFLTRSWVLFFSLLLFQFAAHWIILSEERWCEETFGLDYLTYKKKVPRYFLYGKAKN
ncbi:MULTISPECIES: methyltransferase family protein [Enterococcus]|uniref:methyltransferase family protein n=1 Tax=Enterococcus TaxID=1350 RepID=UPI00065E2E50|nr:MULTISPECIES: isoprenylcysteine carboxylmethyltransferase family protein [Enterococcus]